MDKKRSPELIELAVKLYRKLKSTQKVASRLELGASTTYRMLKQAGVKIPKRFAPEIQQRKKSLQGELAQQTAEDYAAGMSLAAMRKKYKVGDWAIRTAAKDHGVQARTKGAQVRRFSESERAEIASLYSSGWSQGQIAAKFNSSQVTIGRLCRSMGIKARGDKARGESHGSWTGGRVRIGQYWAVLVSPDDPLFCMAQKTGYVLEHRLVMARLLGRPLSDAETVHHIDDDKANNEPSNLQLRFGRHGKGVVLKCRCCGSSDIVPVELD